MNTFSRISAIVLLGALALVLAQPAAAQQAAPSSIAVKIDAQPMEQALQTFARQSGLQVIFPTRLARNLTSPQIDGRYSPQAALKLLLAGTELSYEFVNEKTVAIRPQSPPAAGIGLNEQSTGADQREDAVHLVRVDPQGRIVEEPQSSVEDSGADAGSDAATTELTVTGSRLRNTSPTAHVIVITREEISRRGLNSAADIVRSLPQNFSSVNLGSTTTRQGDNETPIGTIGISAANLRGLGADATLVLVNGRRIASSPSFNGNGQINLGSIPATAIERVEIVLDGASAIYGADAIGGVINFILMKDYEGASSKARYESGVNGGVNWNVSQTLGGGWGSGHGLLTAEYGHSTGVSAYKTGWTTDDFRSRGGRDRRTTSLGSPGLVYDQNFALLGSLPASYDGTENWTAADLSLANRVPFDGAAARQADGTPTSITRSLALSVEQAFGARVTGFVDAIYSRSRYNGRGSALGSYVDVPASNPYNRLGQQLLVAYIFTNTPSFSSNQIERLNVSAGGEVRLPMADWKLSLTGTFGTESVQSRSGAIDPAIGATANVFGNGSAEGDLSGLLYLYEGGSTSGDTRSYDAFADGRLFMLPGGAVRLGAGVQLRPDSLDFEDGTYDTLELDGRGYFFEASVPFVSARNARPAVQGLLLSLAGRYDDYRFTGRTDPEDSAKERSFTKFSPRIGLRWNPLRELTVRASWGKSFKAPALTELGRDLYVSQGYPFPVLDPVTGQMVQANFGRGGNPDLKPEIADNRSFGLEWSPAVLPGLLLEVTYTAIDWTDRITVLSASDPSVWPYLDRLPALIPRNLSVAEGGDGNPATIDSAANREVNIAGRMLRVMDLSARQTFDLEWGEVNVGVTLARTLKAYDQFLPGTALVERVGTEAGPDRQVWSGELGWTRGAFGANFFTHYSSNYRNTQSTLRRYVDAYTTFDATGFYRSARGLRINAGVLNLTDASFPFIDSARGPYDPSRVDPRGRTFYVEVTQEFGRP